MRLDKLELQPDSPRELYFDASNGVVYALTPEQAAERDPRYAEAEPQPESV